MSGMWKRSHGRTSEAPPDERGGYRYVRPTATAPHLDSTQPSRCRRLRRKPVNRTLSGRSALGARAALHAPQPTFEAAQRSPRTGTGLRAIHPNELLRDHDAWGPPQPWDAARSLPRVPVEIFGRVNARAAQLRARKNLQVDPLAEVQVLLVEESGGKYATSRSTSAM
jgi:hypothetical protein